jgi:type II secretory pathway component PulK
MRRRQRSTMRNERGFTLMLVLWLIVVLGTISATIVVATRETASLTGNVRARLTGRYAAESGVAVATSEIESALQARPDSVDRERYLNQLEVALRERAETPLGDGAFSVTLVDISARLDVGGTDEEALIRFFSLFDPSAAAATASAIRRHIDQGTVTATPGSQSISGGSTLAAARQLRSLDELEQVPGVNLGLLRAAAPYLTVDGDGKINRATASDTVMVAASGSLQDEPSRVLVVSRGWLRGHSLTHEIQAVYAIAGNQLTLVRWRERDL